MTGSTPGRVALPPTPALELSPRPLRARAAPLCPIVPDHGELLALHGLERWYCPHQGHAGRPKRHPRGAMGASRSMFTRDELMGPGESGRDRPGTLAAVG